MLAVQPDYGGFNSKFPGPQIRFHHPESFHDFLAFLTDPKFVAAQGATASCADDENAFHIYSLASVLHHETRHLHDSLLSRLSSNIFRLRVSALVHGIQGIPSLKTAGFIPTPVTRWIRMSEEERKIRLQRWSPYTGGKGSLFKVDNDQAEMIERSARVYDKIGQRLKSLRVAGLQQVHLFEASAVLVQIQAVHQLLGQVHAERFMQILMHGQVPETYSKVVRMLFKLWRKWKREGDLRAMSAILTWAIAGGNEDPDNEDYPTLRFLRLFAHQAEHGLPDAKLTVTDWFRDWDLACGSAPLLDVINNNVAENRVAQGILSSHLSGQDQQTTVILQRCIDAMDTWTKATQNMADAFCFDAEAFVDPRLYINNDQLLQGPIRFDFAPPGGVDGQFFAGRKGFRIWKCKEVDSRTVVSTAFLPSLSVGPAVDMDVAIDTGITLTLGELLFSNLNRNEPDFDICRQQLKAIGITPIEIL